MYILGLNAFHGDSAACILKDGVLIAASEEERFRRIKHWSGLPTQAISFCLQEAGIGIEQVDYITISRDPFANLFRKAIHVVKQGVKLSAIFDRVVNAKNVAGLKQQLAEGLGVSADKITAKIENIEHHRSHLASSFFVSPFEEAALLSIDGFGDFTSTMTAIGKGNDIKVLDKLLFPHSCGIFYTAFTQLLGFPNYGDEYKVMGLAPYGKPVYYEKLKEVVHLNGNGLFKLNTDYFKHSKEGVAMSWNGGSPVIEPIFSGLMAEKFGARKKGDELTQDHIDLAASVQKMCESIIFHCLNYLHEKTGLENLCLSGGVAQNSVANGKILANTGFKRVFVPPAGHDAGTAIGSALFLYHEKLGLERVATNDQAYTGSSFEDEGIRKVLQQQGVSFKYLEGAALYDYVATALTQSKVIGWFQGKAEFGPRALGNRSILVDPRREDAKELLNQKIKRRESFRPFAPSILQDYKDEYFLGADEVPYMEKVYVINEQKRKEIPAVTHVDGTGRLQTVSQQSNERYYQLISKFREKTGVPILLNTSFNENEPIVNTPQEALDCFLRTKMDMLVLGNFCVER